MTRKPAQATPVDPMFFHLADAVDRGILVVSGPEQRCVYANQHAAEIWRAESSDFLQAPLSDLFEKLVVDEKNGNEDGEFSNSHERVAIRKDGSRVKLAVIESECVWENSAATLLIARILERDFDPQNEISTLQDTLKREFAEQTKQLQHAFQQLQLSEGRFRSLIENSNDLVVAVTFPGIVRYASPSVKRWLGYEPAELIGRTAFEFVHPEELSQIFAVHQHSVEHFDYSQQAEVRILSKNGEWRTFTVTAGQMTDIDNEPLFVVNAHDITDHKTVHAQLQRNEASLHALIENAPGIMWSVDRETRLIAGNESFNTLAKGSIGRIVEPGQILLPEDLDPALRTTWQSFHERAFAGENFVVEFSLPFQSNEIMEFHFSPIRSSDGTVLGATVFGLDVTAARMAQRALLESEARYRSLIQQAFDGITVVGENGLIVEWNDAQENITGIQRTEALGKPVWDVQFSARLPAERAITAYEHIKSETLNALATGAASWLNQYATAQIQRPDGRVAVVETLSYPVRTENGFVISSFMRDVTQRQQAEEALRLSEERFRRTFESSGTGMALFNLDGLILQANDALDEILGYEPGKLVGKFLKDITHPEDFDLSLSQIQRLLRNEVTRFIQEKRYLHSTGHIVWGLFSGALVRDSSGQPQFLIGQVQDITALKEAQLQLKYQADLVEIVSDAIISVDMQQKIRSWNKAAEMIYGWPAADVLGRNIHDVLRTEFRGQSVEQAMVQLINDGLWRSEAVQQRRDGVKITVFSSMSLIYDNENNVVGIVGVNHDISERKSAEEAFQILSRRNEGALRLAKMGSWEYDVASGMFTFSDQVYAMHDVTAEEMGGYQIDAQAAALKLGHIDSALTFGQSILQAVMSDDPNFEIQLDGKATRKNGEPFWVTSWFRVEKDAQGNTVKLHGVQQDITERKQAEEYIRESEERMRQVTNNMVDMITMFDKNSHYTYLSPSVKKILGYDPPELINRSLYEFIPSDELEDFKNDISALLAGENNILQFRFRHKEGNYRWLESTGQALIDASGQAGFVMGSRDITDRKVAELRLQAALDDLKRSNGELERFAYVASHDLQEPLRMITSYLQLVERRYGDLMDDQGREFIEFAVNGALRMKMLIDDLLAYSRVGTRGRSFQPVNMEVVLARVKHTLQFVIAENQAEITHSALPTVLGDELQLEQLLRNLIGNAIKFRKDEPPHVQVHVEMSHATALGQPAEWIFSIRDNGIGFDLKFAQRIFVIFQRLHTHEQYPGTGIGLAISKRIVERHGGRIWAESVEGQGATFYFTLPA